MERESNGTNKRMTKRQRDCEVEEREKAENNGKREIRVRVSRQKGTGTTCIGYVNKHLKIRDR